jgi:hypothetical protein
MDRSTTFATEAEALAIPPPVTKTHIEHWSIDSCFGLRIMRARASDGRVSRRWLARYYEGGKDFRENLGAVGRVSWEQARLAALTKRAQAQARRERGIVIPTFAEAYEDYKYRRGRTWSLATREDYLKKYELLAPFLASKRIDRITFVDISKAYNEIRDRVAAGKPKPGPKSKSRKPSKWQTGEASAVAALNLAKTIFNAQEGLSRNPCQQLIDDKVFRRRPPRTSQVTRSQLSAFWAWLHTKTHLAVRDHILCALFMSLRASVAGSMQWDNLIEDHGRFVYTMLPDQRGNKARVLAPIPVPTYLAELVFKPRLALKKKDDKWIIESPKKKGHPLRSIRGSLLALKNAENISISLHDLRRTITSAVVRTSDMTTARRVLTHSVTAYEDRIATSGAYFVGEYDDMRRAMNRAVAYIRKIAEPPRQRVAHGEPEAPPPEVLAAEGDLVDRLAEEELLTEIDELNLDE